MLTIFLRAIILYAVSVLCVRLMGKRQIGQLQPYELVAAILIADLVAEPMSGADTPLLHGIVPIAALALMHSLMDLLGMKSPAFRRFLNGSARVLVLEGSIQYDALRRVCMTVSDLLEDIRARGILNIRDVGTAVLETNGTLSVFPKAASRPLTPEDLGLNAPEDEMPHVLITDGAYREGAIREAGLTRQKLDSLLRSQGVREKDRVLLCSLDNAGTLFFQLCGTGQKARSVQVGEGQA